MDHTLYISHPDSVSLLYEKMHGQSSDEEEREFNNLPSLSEFISSAVDGVKQLLCTNSDSLSTKSGTSKTRRNLRKAQLIETVPRIRFAEEDYTAEAQNLDIFNPAAHSSKIFRMILPIGPKSIKHGPKKNIKIKLEESRKAAWEQQSAERLKRFSLNETFISSISEKISTQELKINNWTVGISFTQGKRKRMEDRHIAFSIKLNLNSQMYIASVFGIFDGHNGSAAAEFVKKNIGSVLKKKLEFFNQDQLSEAGIYKALKQCFIKLDAKFIEQKSGTTAIVIIILNDTIWCCCVGDSRAVLIDKFGQATQASEDANPLIPFYRNKIENAGGGIVEVYSLTEGKKNILTHRVHTGKPTLNMARSIGDHNFATHNLTGQRCIVPTPRTTNFSLKKYEDGRIILGSDGFWDVISTNQLADVIKRLSSIGQGDALNTSYCLVNGALVAKSKDNITVMVIQEHVDEF